jgi:hypothetical protein
MKGAAAPTVVRRVCALLFVACIAGLIVSSIAGNNEGWVLSIGAIGASAAVILIVTTLVASQQRVPEFSDAKAEEIEARIVALVTAGADEAEVRELVRESIRLGRGL